MVVEILENQGIRTHAANFLPFFLSSFDTDGMPTYLYKLARDAHIILSSSEASNGRQFFSSMPGRNIQIAIIMLPQKRYDTLLLVLPGSLLHHAKEF